MEMEDHHHHPHPLQYTTMADLRQLMNAPRSTHIPSIPAESVVDLFPGHPNLTPTPTPTHNHPHYHMMPFGRHEHQLVDIMPPASTALHHFPSHSGTLNTTITVPTSAAATASTPPLSGTEADTGGCFPGDTPTARWPRQETLTLLEIRSRLHPRFKHSNQKGPLWDELSRIMSEEYGYQRSGKKCREKFENLYKYYKKTKEGKAGRQDGKHYRFFRQLEALFGENTNPSSVPESNNFGSTSLQFQTPSQTNQEASMFQCYKHCDSVSLTHTHSTELDLDASSSDVNDESLEKRRKRGRRNWKGKIKEFIDAEMKKVMEKQEAWLDRVTKTLEEKEKERVLREEEWSRQETARLEREHEFWAKERTWIETRDAALMEALQKLTGRHIKADPPPAENHINEDESEILHSTDKVGEVSWPESEVTTLVQIRAEMESRIGQNDCSEEVLWEEVATKMACFGYQKNASMCKDKWEDMRNYHKKRRENSRSCFYLEANDQSSSLYNQGSAYCDVNQQRQDGSSPSNSNVGNESCFPLLMCEGENLWENYGFKLNKANQNP